MKIGILTFHRATNYGALLQAYALQQVINNLGYNVQIVDYKCGQVGKLFLSLDGPNFTARFHKFLYNCYLLLQLPFRLRRRNVYTDFSEKYMKLSEKDFDLSDSKWGCFVMGSDQVWNICLTGGYDRYFYGDFPVAEGTRKVGYAVSASENLQESMSDARCQKALGNFDAIGCREKELLNAIKDKVTCPTALVIDPTLLGGKSVFESLTTDKYKKARPYLLIYQMNTSKDSEIHALAKKIAQERGWDVREIPSVLNYKKMLWQKGWDQWTTPVEFVDLFRNAQFVITTSFHGLAFSLIFNKPFYQYSINEKIDARADDLLNNVGLKERKLYNTADANISSLTNIDWDNTNRALAELRNKSLAFLNSSIKGEN